MGISAVTGSAPTTVAAMLKRNYDDIEIALHTLQSAVHCDCTGISWYEPGEDQVRILPTGLPELSRLETTPAMPGTTICSYPLKTRKPLAISHFDSDAPEGYTRCNFMVAEGLNSYLAHPVPRLGADIRMLACAMSREERGWSEADIEHSRRAALAVSLILGPAQELPTQTRH